MQRRELDYDRKKKSFSDASVVWLASAGILAMGSGALQLIFNADDSEAFWASFFVASIAGGAGTVVAVLTFPSKAIGTRLSWWCAIACVAELIACSSFFIHVVTYARGFR
jgi:hypothetical protein